MDSKRNGRNGQIRGLKFQVSQNSNWFRRQSVFDYLNTSKQTVAFTDGIPPTGNDQQK